MFDSITISAFGSQNSAIDPGFLAECLLFYRKVRVVTGAVTLKTLVRAAGAEELLELVDRGYLEIEFLDNSTGIITVKTNIGECHDLGMIGSVVLQLPQVARKIAQEEAGGSGKRANRLFDRLNKSIIRSEYTKELIKQSQDDLLNQGYLEEAARNVLAGLVPDYRPPDTLVFKPTRIPKLGIHFDTNIDFNSANEIYHQTVSPKHSSLTPAFVLAQVSMATVDIGVASRSSSEIAVDPLKSIIVASRFTDLLKKAARSREQLEIFREVTIEKSRSIREIVNNGDKTFRDVIGLIEKAGEFKKWVEGASDSDDLRSEYTKAVSVVDWAEKLPAKEVRFLLMTGLGVLAGVTLTPLSGSAVAAGLNAADYFLLDRILKGWRPNQFVEGPLKKFVG